MMNIKQIFYIKSKKVHVPYKYIRSKFPEIKYEKIYNFILESMNHIQDFYKYCKQHSNNNNVNINDKSKVIKCNYNNCKKNIKSDNDYCQNHKYK